MCPKLTSKQLKANWSGGRKNTDLKLEEVDAKMVYL